MRDWLDAVGLDPSFATRFPHQFSGGPRQRVAIAHALSMKPDALVCDEQVAALDVSIQVLVINMRPAGSVLGIDVGFSPTRRSSAVCRLDWDARRVAWTIRRFRALPAEQAAAIMDVSDGAERRIEAAAFDGPLRRGLDVIGRYRAAERMLTRRLGVRIGKPGQASAPAGRKLNAAANECARIVLERRRIASATHAVPIDGRAVGDPDNGWIVLPPRPFVQDWAWVELEANAREEGRSGCLFGAP